MPAFGRLRAVQPLQSHSSGVWWKTAASAQSHLSLLSRWRILARLGGANAPDSPRDRRNHLMPAYLIVQIKSPARKAGQSTVRRSPSSLPSMAGAIWFAVGRRGARRLLRWSPSRSVRVSLDGGHPLDLESPEYSRIEKLREGSGPVGRVGCAGRAVATPGSQGPDQTRSKPCRHAAHARRGRETVPLLWTSFGGKDCDCTRMAWMDHAGERGHL